MSIEVSRQSEPWLRVLLEHTTDTIALVTCDGTITYTGPSIERVTGYTVEEAVGRNCFEFVHPQDLDYTTRQLTGILGQPGNSTTVEFRYHHKNDTWRWMEGTMTNLLDDPLVGAVVCNYRDITERKQAEAERQQLLARERTARAEAEVARRRVEELNRQLEAEKDALRHAEQEAQARAAELEAVFEAMTE